MIITSRRVRLSCVLVLVVALGTPLMVNAAASTSEVTVFTAKKIITMEPSNPVASAVAVHAGRILAVRSLQEVQSVVGDMPYTTYISFEDQVLLPGLIDNHLHPTMAAMLLPMEFITPFDWRFPGRDVKGIQGEEAYRLKLKAEVAKREDADWFFTWGYHHYFHGAMSRAFLDNVSETQPVIVWHRSFHELFANSAGIKSR